MHFLKLVAIITAIIVAIVVVGIGISSSSRPSLLPYFWPAFLTGNDKKTDINQEFKQPSWRLHSTLQNLENAGATENDNSIIRQFFLNISTHIDTPYVREYSMPNGTWPNGILVARNGLVWTTGTKSHTLISFDPKQGRIISS